MKLSWHFIIYNVFPDITNDCLQESLSLQRIKTLPEVSEMKILINDNVYVFNFPTDWNQFLWQDISSVSLISDDIKCLRN